MADEHHSGEESKKHPTSDSVASLKNDRLNFFSTYVELPNGVSYENQEDDEKILVFLRRHPVTNFPWIFIALFLYFLPFLVAPILPGLFETMGIFDVSVPGNYIFILSSFYFLIVTGYWLLCFISWFYNISMVTNNEVVDIDYTGVFHKSIATTNLREIQDVEYIQKGLLQTFFNYGDVFIQTAGSRPNLEFLRIPHPAKVSDIIMDEKRKVEEND